MASPLHHLLAIWLWAWDERLEVFKRSSYLHPFFQHHRIREENQASKIHSTMNFIIALSVLCLSIFTQALPAPIDGDAAVAEIGSAVVERDASIPPDSGPSVPACWTGLECSFHRIEDMSLSTRLLYVQYMETRFIPLNAGNQFRAIEGVIKFFISKGLGGPGTWVSYVDAGIVEGIQRGGAIALGIGKSEGGNPGSALWADFLTKMKHKDLKDRNVSRLSPPSSWPPLGTRN